MMQVVRQKKHRERILKGKRRKDERDQKGRKNHTEREEREREKGEKVGKTDSITDMRVLFYRLLQQQSSICNCHHRAPAMRVTIVDEKESC